MKNAILALVALVVVIIMIVNRSEGGVIGAIVVFAVIFAALRFMFRKSNNSTK